jgi:polyisoprenyl-phosphate glycosyltransferase
MLFSVIVPVYNGVSAIRELYDKISQTFSKYEYHFEVIFVFDHGNTEAWIVLKDLERLFPDKVSCFNLLKNYGQHRALLFGISKAKGDFVVTIDEDLQHIPLDIIKLINKQKEKNYDVVYGNYKAPNHSFIRNYLSRGIYILLIGSIKGLYKKFSPFRLIKRETAMKLADKKHTYYFIDAIIGRVTNCITTVPVSHEKSIYGVSSYSWLKLINHLISIVAEYSNMIKIFYWSSVILVGFSIVLTTLALINLDFGSFNFLWPIIAGIFGILILLMGCILQLIKYNNHRSSSEKIEYQIE